MTSTWHPLLQLIVIALAAARITVLLVNDAILDLPRGMLASKVIRHPYLSKLLECHWCMGWWVSLAWSLAWFRWPAGTSLVAIPWSVAMSAWWFGASWLGDD